MGVRVSARADAGQASETEHGQVTKPDVLEAEAGCGGGRGGGRSGGGGGGRRRRLQQQGPCIVDVIMGARAQSSVLARLVCTSGRLCILVSLPKSALPPLHCGYAASGTRPLLLLLLLLSMYACMHACTLASHFLRPCALDNGLLASSIIYLCAS